LAGTNPERHVIRTRLDSFYQSAAAADAPEAHRLAATVEAWWLAIEAGILTGYSNSRSEGYNRLAKHQGRNAFGFRNPVNLRRRMRYACTRQHRRASAARSTCPVKFGEPLRTGRSDAHACPVRVADNRLEVTCFATQGALMQSVMLAGRPGTGRIGAERGHLVYTVDVELPPRNLTYGRAASD
jgi:hypothetical protein